MKILDKRTITSEEYWYGFPSHVGLNDGVFKIEHIIKFMQEEEKEQSYPDLYIYLLTYQNYSFEILYGEECRYKYILIYGTDN